jgi:GntR family transcriptional regulator
VDAYVAEVTRQGREPGQQIYIRSTTAEPHVAYRLHIAEGDSVWFRQMWRHIDEVPWSIEASYYPDDLVKGTELTEQSDVGRGGIRVLAELGHEQVGYTDEIRTRMPHDDESEYFDLDGTVPVMEHWRTAYSHERPIRTTQTVFPGDRNLLRYEVKAVPQQFIDEPWRDFDVKRPNI